MAKNSFTVKLNFCFSISSSDVMQSVHEWMKSTVNEIEAEDGKMMAKVYDDL